MGKSSSLEGQQAVCTQGVYFQVAVKENCIDFLVTCCVFTLLLLQEAGLAQNVFISKKRNNNLLLCVPPKSYCQRHPARGMGSLAVTASTAPSHCREQLSLASSAEIRAASVPERYSVQM